ncbi:efflux RND transporter periplasmic adaptor subunit [Myroides guanonis]|uniref:Membrane fusion protein, multidrug efflux system n=1 Tax=Myroides guanonis TaxID=1150112 RepID=A0A1I3L9M8_9FLAO|nr:efflux RND transporter periplasmic adaptor subunit [Myroides guanonis]SFI81166.1 membrane fusion protein, multidrug efflux system [Myroides guanonis]
MITRKKNLLVAFASLLMIGTLVLANSCNISTKKPVDPKENALALPVIKIDTATAITVKDYIGTIEGKVNVEIRPQVEGILDEIYVDEGAFVKEGQPLFKINPQPYQEKLNNEIATENVEKAKLKNAQLEIDRLKPLIDNEVIAEVQLETAKSNYEIAKASLAKASASVASAKISLEYTIIKAPVSGYIGRIPKRIGNLVAKNDSQPMTVLSDVSDVYVYFGMSESDFLYFTKSNQKLDTSKTNDSNQNLPKVTLILADGHEYTERGVVDAINGQVNRNTGAISLRATFPNSQDVMRSGNSGTVKLQETKHNVILVPQVATTSIQDKTFVYLLDNESKVKLQSISIEGVSGTNYIVTEGLKRGDIIIKTGFDKLTEGMYVKPMN